MKSFYFYKLLKYCLFEVALLIGCFFYVKGQPNMPKDRYEAAKEKEQPNTLQVKNPYVIPASCIACADGIIDTYYKVSGGSPPYTYQWSNGSTNSYIINVSMGYYTVTISDAVGHTNNTVCFVPVIDQ